MEGLGLFILFIAAVALVMIMIIKLKINAFISLLGVSFLVGLGAMMPLPEISNTIATGFGNTLKGVGIVIALGIILGEILYRTGSTEQIANTMLRVFGKENSPLAINMTGYVISIPVFFDAAFVILVELARQISRKTRIPFINYVTCLAVGLIVTHAVVVPTPGPLAVIGNMDLNVGVFLLYSIIVSIPASLIGGWLYGKYLGKKAEEKGGENLYGGEPAVKEEEFEGEKPSGGLAIFVLLFPIILLLLGTVMGMILPEGSALASFFAFIGDKNTALFLGVIVSILALRKYFRSPLEEIIASAGSQAGMVLLITGAGGSFGAIINATGIGDYLVETMQTWGFSAIILAFLFSQILRSSLGSTTVALVTTSAIMAPVVAQTGASGILVGLAICLGGIGGSLPNDSGFWVVNRFSGFSFTDTIKSWTLGGTIAGVSGLIIVLILNLFSGILPGL